MVRAKCEPLGLLGLVGRLPGPFRRRLRRRSGLRLGRGLVRARLGNDRRLWRIALVGRGPGLRDSRRLGRRLEPLGGPHAGLRALHPLLGSVDQGLDLGLLCGDLVDDLLYGRPLSLDARFVLVEHRVPETLERAGALALEVGAVAPGPEEVDLAAAPRRDRVAARAEARPEPCERVLRRAALLRARREEDDRGREERDDPPRPDARDEEDDRADDERSGDDDERVRRPELRRRRLDRGLGFDSERPTAFGAEPTPVRSRVTAVRALRQERPPSPRARKPGRSPARARASPRRPPGAAARPRPRSRRRRPSPSGGRTRAP